MLFFCATKVWSWGIDGWMGGWVDGRAVLRIAYTNQKLCLYKIMVYKVFLLQFGCNFCSQKYIRHGSPLPFSSKEKNYQSQNLVEICIDYLKELLAIQNQRFFKFPKPNLSNLSSM